MNPVMEKIIVQMEFITKGQREMQKEISRLKGIIANYDKAGKTIKKTTGQMAKFKMEFLGVMFAGMAMQRFFLNLLQPAMDAFGVFDLWNDVLLVTFIPIMDLIFPYLLEFMDWFMNLPEPVQKAIGIFVLLGVGLGTLLKTIGEVTIGLNSMKMAFGSSNAVASAAAAPTGGIGSIMAMAGKIVGVSLILYGITEFMEGGKKAVNGLLDVLAGAGFILGGATGGWIAAGAILLNITWDKISGQATSFVSDLKNILMLAFAGYTIANIPGAIIGLTIGVILSLLPPTPENINEVSAEMNRIQQKMSGTQEHPTDMSKYTAKYFGINETESNPITKGLSLKSLGIGNSSITTKGFKDFIWRPGTGAASISPNDTVVGFKGDSPFNSGVGDINITQNINVGTASKDEISRMINDNNKRLVDDIKRLVATRG